MERELGFNSRPSLIDFSFSETESSLEKETFRTLSSPITAQWELTPWCNGQCIHCYNFWRQGAPQKLSVTPETIETYKTASSEIIGNRIFHVTVTGGEPLAVLKWAYPYLKQLADNDVGISLNSNLTMLTKEKAQLLKNLGIRSILTSMMAADTALNDELMGMPRAQQRIKKGIQIAREEGFWVGVNMVVTKKNLFEIFATAQCVKKLGVTAFSVTKASTPINSPDFSEYVLSREEFRFMFQELLRVRDELGLTVDSLEFYPMCFFDTQKTRDFFGNRICNAGKTACTIGFDGSIRPCSHASQIYGDIKEGGLKEAWLNLQPWRTDILIPQECNECQLRNICRGGCRTEAFAVSGDLQAEDPYCDFSRPPISRTPLEKIHVNKNAQFTFHPGLKAREESFGGILFITPVRWAPATHGLFEFFKKRRKDSFRLHDLAKALSVDIDDILSTAEILLYKTIIQERG